MEVIRRIFSKLFSSLFKGYVYSVRFVFGRRYILLRINEYSRWIGAVSILRILGASVGEGTHIEPGVRIQNARGGRCSNLRIGEHVYIGPECLFELASCITIEDYVVISARTTFVTHADVGDRPLKHRFPRKEGPIRVGKGTWVGVNTTVLHGVSIGEYTVIGAMSLVNKNIPANCIAFGIPCRVAKQFDHSPKNEDGNQVRD
jgi:galactoside O-acetyltransferase